MRRETDDSLLATTELMLLHVDMSGPRAAAFGGATATLITAIAADHASLGKPERIGRVIGLR
jgi:acyl-CoA thioester hydrolase